MKLSGVLSEAETMAVLAALRAGYAPEPVPAGAQEIVLSWAKFTEAMTGFLDGVTEGRVLLTVEDDMPKFHARGDR